ncbi:hypothetical protein WBJ53_26170 [Spirosoma sp. SC4-14]|uniref:hypothetical protein n=1 Tax=Spirosoma sp. SC4-14 TaxID=3128900 RepID=UPI0030CCA8E0
MTTLEIQLDSAEKLRANWPAILADPAKLQELLDAETVTVAAQAAINANVDWRIYTGRVDIAMYYRAFGEFIAWKTPYVTINLDQDFTQLVAKYVLENNPEVGGAYLAANDGVLLEILPPYVPPVPEPDPVDPEQPTDPEPPVE